MNILHLIYDHIQNPWVGGGGAVRVSETLKILAKKGHEITIVSGNYPGAVDYAEGKLNYIFLGSKRNYILSTFSYAIKAARYLKKHGNEFDIIVEDFAPWNPVFSPFLTRKPVILHINHIEGRNMLKRWSVLGLPFFLIEKFYPILFHHLTVLSTGTKKKLKITHAQIVPAGIESRILVDDVQPSPHKKGDYIIYVGRLHIKNKGLDTLLDAMKKIQGARLVIIGKGGDEAKLRNMASNLPPGTVDFRGFLPEDEKMQFMKEASFFVLPSRFEGQGIVILEAAACGNPVIVSDIPELRYAQEEGFGIAFKKGDSDDLAAKIQYLLENDQMRDTMGWKAREYAKLYTWDKIANDYEEFLKKVTRARQA